MLTARYTLRWGKLSWALSRDWLNIGPTLRSHLLRYTIPARNLEYVPAIIQFIGFEDAFEGLALDLGIFDSTHNGL